MPGTRPSFLLFAISLTLIVALVFALPLFAADTEKVLKHFTGKNGYSPEGGLIFDAAGNLYGTTNWGGLNQCGYAGGCGIVFELTPQADGTWKETVLHKFTFREGGNPAAGLIFDNAGNLYGTATGCGSDGCSEGAVFELGRQADGKWKLKVLYRPVEPWGPVIFDQAGNLYGTDEAGGEKGLGAVFELTPHANGKWTAKTLYSFDYGKNDANGQYPFGGLVFDAAGDLYGVTGEGGIVGGICGGFGCGTVYELAPQPDGTWKESVLHRFNGKDGDIVDAGLIIDAQGNLYGTASSGGSQLCDTYSCGLVFELVPQGGGKWEERVLHNFDFSGGWGSEAGLTFDSAGNLYGTTSYGGVTCNGDSRGCGTAFEMIPLGGGKWRYEVLFKFRGGDGAYPSSNLTFDSSGNLYGETYGGGRIDAGAVFELTP